jgi:hypothetical protein
MKHQIPYVVRPVAKQPKGKFYLYRKRVCSECGFLHLYRKVAEKDPVRYGCRKQLQPSLWNDS